MATLSEPEIFVGRDYGAHALTVGPELVQHYTEATGDRNPWYFGPSPFGGLEAQEDVLELVHAGVGEQQRRVVRRNERRATHHAVPPSLEEGKELLPGFVAGKVSCQSETSSSAADSRSSTHSERADKARSASKILPEVNPARKSMR